MNENIRTVSSTELFDFISALSAAVNTYYRTLYPTCEQNWEVCFLDGMGDKFARISKRCDKTGQHRGAHCFVELATGNILKCAGYKGPEKRNPRGNIRVGDASNCWNGAFMEGCRHTSYLR